MNVTQQPQFMRRRNSSLEESAIRASINQNTLLREAILGRLESASSGNGETDDKTPLPPFLAASATRRLSNASISNQVVRSQPGSPTNDVEKAAPYAATIREDEEVTSYLDQINWKVMILMFLLFGVLGFAARASTYFYKLRLMEDEMLRSRLPPLDPISKEFAANDQLSLVARTEMACIRNSTYCPQLPKSVFIRDWSTKSGACFQERQSFDPDCEKTCHLLLRKRTNNTIHIVRMVGACQIGCAYAKREKSTPKDAASLLTSANCLFDCRNTVWVSLPGKARKCNYDKGLGLLTTDYEKRFGAGVFGAGKACEFGCILGNARVCPQCDTELAMSSRH